MGHAQKLLMVITLLSTVLIGQSIQSFQAEYTYRLGDNDSRADAKRIAFIEAKRLCVEQAGVYLKSEIKSIVNETETGINESFEKKIESVAFAVVKAKIINEHQSYDNGAIQITIQVEAQVDIDAANKLFQLSQIDPELNSQLE